MAYTSSSCEPVRSPRVERFEIPWGHAGIDVTVEHMRALARSSALTETVRRKAELLAGRDELETAANIRRFIARRVRFEFDPPGVELIRTPELLLHTVDCRGRAVGDCDDVAVLAAALGLARGLEAAYILLGFTDAEPYEHVYTELRTPAGWVELDTTRPAQMPPGLEIRRRERRRV